MKDKLRWYREFWFGHFPDLCINGTWSWHSGWYKNKPKLGIFCDYYDGPLLSIHFWKWAICATW